MTIPFAFVNEGSERKRMSNRFRSFTGSNNRPEKPRYVGVTEVRGPYYSAMGPHYLQEIFEAMGSYVDGVKFAGGSSSLMPKELIKGITELAHSHGVYVSSGGWAEHNLVKGRGSFKQYVQQCKELGFDTLELSTGFLKLSDGDLLHLIRTAKSEGLKVKPELGISFEPPDEIPVEDLSAQNGPVTASLWPDEGKKDVDWLIKRAERWLEAGADMIMIDSEGLTKNVNPWRTDIIAKIIGRLGLDKTMFEAAEPRVFEWFIKNYGSTVNLFVDHSQIVQWTCDVIGDE
ncbi:hypothetical protein O6H91_07G028300 [Diphasiastrum complanatum]|uniref:Uncharacterized protein n=3 Tax=Diphasiastrum complanatum TaxID=34168 RepID=A0ACC2D3U3_DIPCM|nr:hypothetical protein O6H91_07G028300 [Diphasiastrum complanatum]